MAIHPQLTLCLEAGVSSPNLDEMPDTFEIKQFLLSKQEDALELILENYALETAERYFDAGIEKGTCKEKIAIARRMEKKNMPVEEIAEYTDLKIGVSEIFG